MRWAFARIYRMSDRVIVHGNDTKATMMRMFDLPEARIEVIPHGDYRFATGDYDAVEAKRWLGLPADSLLILSFGAIREYKGIPNLIEAFADIVGEFPAARLAIVGKPLGIDVAPYRRQIETAGITERVILRPEYVPFPDIGRYFAACDLAAFPYLNINQSGALQLAYGAARPVVATRVGEFPDTVRDGVNGVLVAPGDVAALADALRDLLGRGTESLREMGLRSLELAEEEHSWADIAQATQRTYASLETDGNRR